MRKRLEGSQMKASAKSGLSYFPNATDLEHASTGKPRQVDDMLTQLDRLDKLASSIQVPVYVRPRVHALQSHFDEG